MPVRVVTSRDQQAVTVNALLKYPLILPERILSFIKGQFVAQTVLRNAGSAVGGAVQFRVSSGQFADNPSEEVAEGAEIPLATVTKGDLDSARTKKRALGVAITREMRMRDNMGEVERQLTAVRNTVVRDFDTAFFAALNAAVDVSHVVPASTAWTATSGSTIRANILAAKLLISEEVTPDGSANDFLGYEPTDIFFSPTVENILLNSEEFRNMIYGQINPSNVGSLADIPDVRILGLRPHVTRTLPDSSAVYIVEANTVGGYADEIPLEATELYEARPNQLWRSDVTRSSAVFVDQPLAISKITDVLTGGS